MSKEISHLMTCKILGCIGGKTHSGPLPTCTISITATISSTCIYTTNSYVQLKATTLANANCMLYFPDFLPFFKRSQRPFSMVNLVPHKEGLVKDTSRYMRPKINNVTYITIHIQ